MLGLMISWLLLTLLSGFVFSGQEAAFIDFFGENSNVVKFALDQNFKLVIEDSKQITRFAITSTKTNHDHQVPLFSSKVPFC